LRTSGRGRAGAADTISRAKTEPACDNSARAEIRPQPPGVERVEIGAGVGTEALPSGGFGESIIAGARAYPDHLGRRRDGTARESGRHSGSLPSEARRQRIRQK